jgi:hypothetical protein
MSGAEAARTRAELVCAAALGLPVVVGLGRIVALYYRSSASYHIH